MLRGMMFYVGIVVLTAGMLLMLLVLLIQEVVICWRAEYAQVETGWCARHPFRINHDYFGGAFARGKPAGERRPVESLPGAVPVT